MDETLLDFFDHFPSKEEKIEMRKTSKSPSEWLKLLCRDWAIENQDIVDATDMKFLGYKSYLRGRLSSQLLCRLSIPEPKEHDINPIPNHHQVDFWGVLGIQDEFDKSYIISQIERFCALYFIRAVLVDDDLLSDQTIDPTTGEPTMPLSPNGTSQYFQRLPSSLPQGSHIASKEQRRKDGRKVADKAAREASREEKRQKKLLVRQNREHLIREQKEAALARAADLVRSNRVPIEITRGAAAAQAAANAAVEEMGVTAEKKTKRKFRSDIIVSTASDLDRIVTHAKNLWTKYNAIAKQHHQKVNWSTVAKELGIHVKVREKYARMHSRAVQRGFDFKTCGHFNIKENPHIFLEPLVPQQMKRNPCRVTRQNPCPKAVESPELNIVYTDVSHHITDDQVAAAVDAAIKTVPVAPDVNCYEEAAATVDNVMNSNSNGASIGLSVEDAAQAALAAAPEPIGVALTRNEVEI